MEWPCGGIALLNSRYFGGWFCYQKTIGCLHPILYGHLGCVSLLDYLHLNMYLNLNWLVELCLRFFDHHILCQSRQEPYLCVFPTCFNFGNPKLQSSATRTCIFYRLHISVYAWLSQWLTFKFLGITYLAGNFISNSYFIFPVAE